MSVGIVFYEIITNKVLVIPVCTWAIAQALKVFIGLVREKHLDLRYFVASGDGGHHFSRTAAEHNRWKSKFDRIRRDVRRKERMKQWNN